MSLANDIFIANGIKKEIKNLKDIYTSGLFVNDDFFSSVQKSIWYLCFLTPTVTSYLNGPLHERYF